MLTLLRRWLARFPSNLDFRLLLGAFAVSSLGDQVFNISALLWLTVDIGHGSRLAPLLAAGVVVSGALPSFFLVPLAGVLVDRWDHRRTMLVSDLACLNLSTLVTVTALAAPLLPIAVPVATAYTVIAITSVFYFVFGLARVAITTSVVEPERLAAGNGLFAMAASGVGIIGPAIAAPLVFSVGPVVVFGLNALSFAASWLMVARTRPSRSPAKGSSNSIASDLRLGIIYSARNGDVRALVAGWSFGAIQSAAVTTVGVFFVQHQLHRPSADYGWLVASLGLGALVGATLTTWLGDRIPLRGGLVVSMAMVGVLLLVFSRQTQFMAALTLYVAVGIAETGSAVVNSVLFQRVVPQSLMGRVAALTVPVYMLASLAGASVAGAAAVRLGDHLDLIIGAVRVLGILAAIYVGVELLPRKGGSDLEVSV